MTDPRYGASKHLDEAMERRDKVLMYSLIALTVITTIGVGAAVWALWTYVLKGAIQ